MGERSHRGSRTPTGGTTAGVVQQQAGKRTLTETVQRRHAPWPAVQAKEAEAAVEAEGEEHEAEEQDAKAIEAGDDKPAAPAEGGGGGGGGGGGEQESVEAETEAAASMGGEVVQAKLLPGAVQRVKKKGAPIDISGLTADQCKEHIARSFRLAQGKGAGDDADYEYAPDDVKNLQARQKQIKEDELKTKWTALTTALGGELAGMASAADFVSAPPWIGHVTNGVEGSENNKPGNMAADAATVVAAWKTFLGAGPYSNKHPRTGVAAAGRLVSGDGKRSIRYGDHEKVKTGPNGHHYHEETWTWDGAATVTVANMVQKVPVS